jgi:hypothetical protein
MAECCRVSSQQARVCKQARAARNRLVLVMRFFTNYLQRRIFPGQRNNCAFSKLKRVKQLNSRHNGGN